MREKTIPSDYEDRIGNLICPMLREHDVLLDIHSFSGEGVPFVFAGPLDNAGDVEPFRFAEAEGEFAARLGTGTVIHGWLDVYGRFLRSARASVFPTASISEGVGTTEYMRFSGGYGVTLECGAHDDPKSADVGYAAIVNALAHLGLIDAAPPPVAMTTAIQIVEACCLRGRRRSRRGRLENGRCVCRGPGHCPARRRRPGHGPERRIHRLPNRAAKPGDGLCYFGVASQRDF